MSVSAACNTSKFSHLCPQGVAPSCGAHHRRMPRLHSPRRSWLPVPWHARTPQALGHLCCVSHQWCCFNTLSVSCDCGLDEGEWDGSACFSRWHALRHNTAEVCRCSHKKTHTCSLPHDKAIPIQVPWPRRLGRVLIALAQGLCVCLFVCWFVCSAKSLC